MIIPIVVLAIVFALIAVRQVGSVKLGIWQIMLFGALAILAAGQISPEDALKAINLDVMLFLFSMFIVGTALEESGYLSQLSYRFFKRAKSVDSLVLFILFGAGIASAFLLNDTLAIIGTPVVLALAKKHGASAKLLLLGLAFAATIGSVMSPIGNPQNLLIAIGGNFANPFITFFKYLLIPTAINLFLAYALLKVFYKEQFHAGSLNHEEEPIADPPLARLSKISLIMVILLVIAKIAAVFLGAGAEFRLTYIALLSALPIVLFSPKRFGIMKRIDWRTLVFFAAMFVLMESVWQSGFFQSAMASLDLNVTSTVSILAVSVLLSQLISNVPLAALYLPVLVHAGGGTKEMIALAAGSTIAGNLFILGAASNVIIIQNAEKKAGETITFFEFAKIGIPLTLINVLVYWIFL